MNSILFLSQNFGVLVLLIGFLIVLISDIHLERRMIGRFGMAVTFLLVYTVTYYIESLMLGLKIIVDVYFHIVPLTFHTIEESIVICCTGSDLIQCIDHLDYSV